MTLLEIFLNPCVITNKNRKNSLKESFTKGGAFSHAQLFRFYFNYIFVYPMITYNVIRISKGVFAELTVV